LIELGTNWAKDRSRNWPKLTLMNPPCNHKPRLGERGKCEALSFSLSHSFPSLSILNRHAEHINTFQQATRKIRQKHFCWKQYNELDTIYQALLLKEENHFVKFIEERTYCLSREFGFQDFDEFLANRSHPKGVLVLKSTFFLFFFIFLLVPQN
jgi:hypothetical protein